MSRRRARLEQQQEDEERAATLDSRGYRTRGFKSPEIGLEVVIATACDAAWRTHSVRLRLIEWLARDAGQAQRRVPVKMPGGEPRVAVFLREVRNLAGLELVVVADAKRPRTVYQTRRLP